MTGYTIDTATGSVKGPDGRILTKQELREEAERRNRLRRGGK